MLWKISFYYGSCLCDIMPPKKKKEKKKSLYNFKDYDSLELL